MSEPSITVATPGWNHGGTQPMPIRWVVLHDEEYPVRDTSAEEVANFFANRPVGQYGSAHYVTDANSEQHCVPEGVAAYHAPNLSFMGSIGIEQDGYARFSRAEWLNSGSKATIARTAARCAELCRRYNIPRQYVNAQGLNAGVNGITSHYEVNHSQYGATDHWDPGYNFPWTEFFNMLNYGYQLLGDVKGFQKANGLTVDGDAGLLTVLKLGDVLAKTWGVDPHVDPAKPSKPKTGLHRFDDCPVLNQGDSDRSGFDPKVGDAYSPVDWPIHALQSSIKKLGFVEIIGKSKASYATLSVNMAIDGDFGPYTQRVVKAYQQARGLVVDGVVGPATWQSIAKKLTDLHA